ncbi:MAG TPA: hypothetical protein VIL86_04645 [Tepidisphaeraceae bacterium]|jgi:hypothetical protein
MRRKNLLAAMMVGLAFVAAARADDAPELPAKLAPYAALAKKCRDLHDMVTATGWKTVYDEQFKKSDKPSWLIDSISNVEGHDNVDKEKYAATMKLDKLDGRDVLLWDIQEYGSGMLAVGPKLKGDYTVEFTAKMLSEKGGDLSIFVGAIGEGAGVQLGAWNNTKCQIWNGPMDTGGGKTWSMPTELPNGPKIEKDKWHTVKLEVKEGAVNGIVDGQALTPQPIKFAGAFDPAVERQPMFYTFGSKIAIAAVKISQYGVHEVVKEEEAWPKVFGEAKKADVRSQIDALVKLLGDDDASVRQGAATLLEQMAEMAIPALEAVSTEETEVGGRAKEVLQAIKDANTPAAPAKDDFKQDPKAIELKVQIGG